MVESRFLSQRIVGVGSGGYENGPTFIGNAVGVSKGQINRVPELICLQSDWNNGPSQDGIVSLKKSTRGAGVFAPTVTCVDRLGRPVHKESDDVRAC